MTYKPTRLSAKAFDDLRAIVKDEISEPMTDEEIEAMGTRLLRLFSTLSTSEPETVDIQPTVQEQKALDFIKSEIVQGRSPSVRGVAKAVGFKSSRSGHRLLRRLIARGWVHK